MKTPSRRDTRKPDEGQLASTAKIARLRALRLSKEAADREVAEQSAAAKRAEAKSRPRGAGGAKARRPAAGSVTAEPSASESGALLAEDRQIAVAYPPSDLVTEPPIPLATR